MKLSHDSKFRLTVGGILTAAILIAVVALPIAWGETSHMRSELAQYWAWRGGAIVNGDGVRADRTYGAFQTLSSSTFDADSVRSLGIDVSSGTVEVKPYDGDRVKVTESGHLARGVKPARAATEGLATVEDGRLSISKFGYDDENATRRVVTVEIPKKLASRIKGIDADVESGDLRVTGVTCESIDFKLASGDIEFSGGVTGTLTVDVGSGDLSMKLDRAPATAMNVTEGSGDIDLSIPKSTGFAAELSMESGDFDSDFISGGVDGETISSLKFDNGDKSASYRFSIDSGDMQLSAH